MTLAAPLAPDSQVVVPTPLAARAAGHLGERIVLHGWVAAVRDAGRMSFVELHDRSGTIQVVCPAPVLPDARQLTKGSALRVTGVVRENPRAQFGAIEVHAEELELLALADVSERRDRTEPPRHLELRSAGRFLVFAVQTTLTSAIREFLLARDFTEVHTPKLTAAGSESGAAVFELPYFEQRAHLAQSPQFYMQLAMAAGFDRAFEIGPVFRAEDGSTNRHAAEFTCFDVELAWVDGHEVLMLLEEELLRYALSVVRDVHGDEIEACFGVTVEVPEPPLPRIASREAQRVLRGNDGDERSKLTHSDEQELCRRARAQSGHGFVFVTDYPRDERPFYTMADGDTTRSFDLLWRGIEITSGCQREHRADRLRAQIARSGLDAGAVETYLETHYLPMFQDGCPPHGGFGIGLERLTMALLGRPSIRETSFVFRGPGHLHP